MLAINSRLQFWKVGMNITLVKVVVGISPPWSIMVGSSWMPGHSELGFRGYISLLICNHLMEKLW